VADVYDSLRSPRPYRNAHSVEGAREVLVFEAGKALDPRLVTLYLDALPELERQDDAHRQGPAGQAAVSTFAGIAQAQRESALLFELSQALAATLGVEETIEALMARLGGLLPYEAAALFLAGDDGLLRCAAAYGLDATSLRILPMHDDQAAPSRAVRTGQTVLNGDPVREVAVPEGLHGPPWRSSLATPLVAGGRAFGALVLYAARSHAFERAQATTLERAAKHAAASLANARRFDQAQTDSLTDALTGLPNARFLTMHLAQELSRTTRLGSQMALVIVDVDDFKRINDTAGHHVGDRVLREVGRVLRASVRAYDVCARYAGDEFLVMLPECGVENIPERLAGLERVLNRIVIEAGERRLRVRASVGAAVFPADGGSFEALLVAADRRMYGNKARSRLRVLGTPGTTRENESLEPDDGLPLDRR
jgi:diguanylate cyclase (GGDEF)-like protein